MQTLAENTELTSEPIASPESPAAPYIPDYLGDHFASIIVQVLFFAFLLVFVVKLVKWFGRAWFMSRKFFVEKEINVGRYEPDATKTVSIGWVDQGKFTFTKAFRDWCWPPSPTVASPFQNWIDELAKKIEDLCYGSYAQRDPPESFDCALDIIYLDISVMLDYDRGDGRGNGLAQIGASKRAIQEIENIRSEIDSLNKTHLTALETGGITDAQRDVQIASFRQHLHPFPNRLRQIAIYGRRPMFDVTGQ